MRILRLLCCGAVWIGLTPAALAEVTRAQLDRWLNSDVSDWRWRLGQAPGAERPEYDDANWERVEPGFKWRPHDSSGWFRTRITVPETVNGIAIRGGNLRLKVGVDNGARAYVNGLFRQDFEWSKGDFTLTEHARPGEIITVALQATNRPGSGSLLEARLVYGPGEALLEGLRGLATLCDAALEDADYVPPTEADHWRGRVQEALQTLDATAYTAGNQSTFLASVEQARKLLLSDRAMVEERLRQTADALQTLKQIIRQQRGAGRQLAYRAAEARVVESFLSYVRDDLAESDPGRQLRGLKGAAYIARLVQEAIENDQFNNVTVPQYQTRPWTIRAGAFWQDNRPLYFTGVGHFGQVRQDIPILQDYGLNLIQIEMGPANGLPAPDKIDAEAIRREVVQWLDLAAAHHVAVNLLISPHYFPAWAFDADPAHRQCGQGFIKFCIEAPSTRLVMEQWLDTLMPMIARHPALHSICLSNEPQYQGRCAYEVAAFQEWLKVTWGSLDRANEVYGTHFRRFDEIGLPQAASPYGLCFDRWRFNQDRFVAFHERLRERIHRYDPDLPVHAKVMSHAFEDPGRFETGIDYERFTQLGRIAGNDCVVTFTGTGRGEYACDWQTMAMNYTLQHSVAPHSPIFNSENHLIADGDPRYIPENYIRTVYWQEAIHGQGATATWVWERGQGGDLAENILTRANCVRALGRVALDLQRLAPEIQALSQAPADLAILYAYSSLLPSKDYVDEARAAFEGAYFTGAITDFVSERQVEGGKLGQYKLVIVPRASHGPDTAITELNQYIHRGGTVMTVGDCFTHDEYGRPRGRGLVQSGRGRLLIYPEALTARAYREILERLMEHLKVFRPIRIEGAHGEPLWGVNCRAVEADGRLLVNVLNLSRKPQRIRLGRKPVAEDAVNLLDGTAVKFPFALSPLEPTLLELKLKKDPN